MRKNLLVILGAGSSIPRDMPSVADLDRQMKQWSQEWSASHRFPDYFDSLWNAVETYYGTGK
jgi:hypothetical protein